jgi:hypothetical protein
MGSDPDSIPNHRCASLATPVRLPDGYTLRYVHVSTYNCAGADHDTAEVSEVQSWADACTIGDLKPIAKSVSIQQKPIKNKRNCREHPFAFAASQGLAQEERIPEPWLLQERHY